MKTEIILCDLGRTLIDFDHRMAATNMRDYLRARPDITPDRVPQDVDLYAFLFVPTASGATRNKILERGQGDIPWLCEDFATLFGIEIPQVEMARIWNEMFTRTSDDVFDGMERARARGVRVTLCSNTNASHWEFVQQRYPRLNGLFDELFLSYEMGATKTDPGFFEEILRRTGRPAEAHVFLDDLEENLAAARRVGIETALFDGALPPHPAWA
ncbi:MAG: glucose-phosphatase [Candidatus Sumerlaeota bacterium]|nr:glucose-phosphatase [Candidatus Sumerlaeota bacterium]